MEKNNNKPKLRFPGFTDPWEQRKLGDITSYIKGFAFKSVDYKVYGIRIIRVSDLSKDCVSEDADKIYIDKNKAKQYINYTINNGDIVITTVGSKAELKESAVGRPIIFTESKGYLLNQNLVKIAPIPNYDSQFIYNQLLRERYTKYIADIQRGNANQANITISDLWEYSFHCPAFAEQKKIGQFFNKLDNTITLHKRKLNHLQDKKKSLLQKMFPKNGEDFPELRFLGFTDDWEQRTWTDTVDISTNMVDPRTGYFDNLYHIGPGNIESFTGRLLDNVNTVKEDNLISGKFHFNKGDVIYGKINPQLGKYVYAPYEGLSSADAYVLNAKNGIAQTFLFTLLQTQHFFKYSVSVSMRSGMPKINRDELNEYSFMSPCNKEQEKIGEFFLNLDNLITLHQRKLNHLKEQKKALLQQMFV